MYKIILEHNTCFKQNKPMQPVGIVIHSTGVHNSHLNYFVQPRDEEWDGPLSIVGISNGKGQNHKDSIVGAHAFIGRDRRGDITTIQTLPWDIQGMSCGFGVNGSCDEGWIQIEICEDGKTNSEYFNNIYNELVNTITEICKIYPNIHPLKKINGIPQLLSHCEAGEYGMAVQHYDVDDWFPRFNKTMTSLRKDVALNLLSN